jgi:hypothetical protein
MGWGIDFNIDIFLSKVSIKNKYELEDLIKEKEADIENSKKELCIIAGASPRDITPPDFNDDITFYIRVKISNILEDILEAHKLLIDLYYYKEYLEYKKDEKEDIS